MLSVVCLFAASPMADDRRLLADRTTARHLRQSDLGYPGSLLSSVNGSAIKRITGWREGLPLVFPPGSIRRPAFTLLYRPVSNEKKTMASTGSLRLRLHRTLAGILRLAVRFPAHSEPDAGALHGMSEAARSLTMRK